MDREHMQDYLFRPHKPSFYTFIQLGQKWKERNKNVIDGYDVGKRRDLGYAVAHLLFWEVSVRIST